MICGRSGISWLILCVMRRSKKRNKMEQSYLPSLNANFSLDDCVEHLRRAFYITHEFF